MGWRQGLESRGVAAGWGWWGGACSRPLGTTLGLVGGEARSPDQGSPGVLGTVLPAS